MRQARCPRCDERARAGTGNPWAISQPFFTYPSVREDGCVGLPGKLPYTEFSPPMGAGRDLGVFSGVFLAGFGGTSASVSLEQLGWGGKREGFEVHVGLIDERFHETHASEREVDDGLKI